MWNLILSSYSAFSAHWDSFSLRDMNSKHDALTSPPSTLLFTGKNITNSILIKLYQVKHCNQVHYFLRVSLIKLRTRIFRALLLSGSYGSRVRSHTWIIFYDISQSLQSHFHSWQAVSVLLWLHFCSMCDSHERVEVLGLGAYIIQKTCSKCFWNLSWVEKYLQTCVPSEITIRLQSNTHPLPPKKLQGIEWLNYTYTWTPMDLGQVGGVKPSCIRKHFSTFFVLLH